MLFVDNFMLPGSLVRCQLKFARGSKKFFCCCSILVEPEEIKRLGKRFKKLDLDQSGSLSVEEFMSLPELQQNPLVQRVIEIFDQDGNGEVDFKGWSNSMHIRLKLWKSGIISVLRCCVYFSRVVN
jgi:hypothetical protein